MLLVGELKNRGLNILFRVWRYIGESKIRNIEKCFFLESRGRGEKRESFFCFIFLVVFGFLLLSVLLL